MATRATSTTTTRTTATRFSPLRIDIKCIYMHSETDSQVQLFNSQIDNYFSTRHNKRRSSDQVSYEVHWVGNLVREMRARENKTIRVGRSYAFLVSHPRWREVFACSMTARRMHHEIVERLEPYLELELSPYTFNNRKGKGCQAAINQLLETVTDVSNDGRIPTSIIKLDLKGYFPSAIWDVAEGLMARVIDKYIEDEDERNYMKWMLMVCIQANVAENCDRRSALHLWDEHIEPEKSVLAKEPGVGASIGALIWQTAMGLYINDEIKWLTDECGLRLVVFVDDIAFVTETENKCRVLSIIPEFRRRLAKKGLRLNEKKFYCQDVWSGCEFLGSRIRPNRIYLNNKTIKSAFRTVEELNAVRDKERNIDTFLSRINSFTGLLKNRTEHKTINRLIEAVDDEWLKYVVWNERRRCFSPKEHWTLQQRLNRKYHLKINRHDKQRKKKCA